MDYLGIFYEAGTGKTMCFLDWAYRDLSTFPDHRYLVVCPASLVSNWEDSITKMSQFEGYTDEGIANLKRATHISSFQKLYQTRKYNVTRKNGSVYQKTERSLREAVDREWDAVIVDESQGLGSHNSAQTKACLQLSKLAKKRIVMSGTPVHGGGGKEDFKKLYGQIKFLNNDAFKNWTDFMSRYVLTTDPWGNPSRYRVDECRKLLSDYGIVARLADCYDMPESTETVIDCPLTETKVYKDIASGNLIPYGIDLPNSGSQYTKLLQICSGSMKRREEDGLSDLILKTSKENALTDIIDGTNDKLVVFCTYRRSIDIVERIGKKLGRSVVVFDGRSKTETWRDFQYGNADMLVCQYQSGGAGLDLFASHTMVLYEPTMSSLLLEQTKARIMRKGQTNKCRYLYLSTPKTIESRVWNTVRSGMDVTTAMMDEWARCGYI